MGFVWNYAYTAHTIASGYNIGVPANSGVESTDITQDCGEVSHCKLKCSYNPE